MTGNAGKFRLLSIIGLGLSAGLLSTISTTYLLILFILVMGILVYIKVSIMDTLLLLYLFLGSLVPVSKMYSWLYLYEGLVISTLCYLFTKCIHDYRKNKYKYTQSGITKLVIFFLLIFAIIGFSSFLVNIDTSKSLLSAFIPVLRPFITIMVVVTTFFYIKRHGYQNVLKTISYSGLFQAIFSILFYLFKLINPGGYGIDLVRSYSSLIDFFPYRFTGTLGANFLGGLLTITIPITFYLYLKAQKYQFCWLINITLQVLTLFFTYTRASIGILFMEVVLFTVLNINKSPKAKLIGATATTFLVAIAVKVPGLTERFTVDSNDRLALAYAGIETFQNNFLIGIGPGQYPEKIANSLLGLFAFTPYGVAGGTPHNTYILVGAENGVFGLVVLIIIFLILGVTIWYKRQRTKNSDEKLLITLSLVALVGFLAQNFSNNLLYIPPVATIFWALVAVLLTI